MFQRMFGGSRQYGRPGAGEAVITHEALRRRRNLEYAWRRHRAARRSEPFMFRVVGKTKRADGTRLDHWGVVGFVTSADRWAGLAVLRRRRGFTHFTLFRDVNAEYALQVGHSHDGQLVINR